MKRYLLIVSLFCSFSWAQNPIVAQFSNAFADVAEEVNPSVVTILANKKINHDNPYHSRNSFEDFFPKEFFREGPQARALGSGVIVDSKQGYVLTNNHVVDDMDKITVKLIDKREYKADVIGTDPKSDLAIIRIDAENLHAIEMGDSDILRVGEWVLAIGSPFNENLSHTVTAGIISALGRSSIIPGDHYEDFIQTDSAINPGNSGGALVNLSGKLIGINTAIATGGFERSNRGVGFAIPSNMVKKVMNDLINEGRVIRSWLGVYIQEVDNATALAMGLDSPTGALVSDVVKGSPAEKAGIEIGDIIRKFDEKTISNPSKLKNTVSSSEPSKRYGLELIRNGKKKKYSITLEELPENPNALAKANKIDVDLGFKVKELSTQDLRTFDLEKDIEGVIVTKVDRKSRAYSAGLRPGDVITRVGQKNVINIKNFHDLFKEEVRGNTVLLLIKRKDMSRFLTFEK